MPGVPEVFETRVGGSAGQAGVRHKGSTELAEHMGFVGRIGVAVGIGNAGIEVAHTEAVAVVVVVEVGDEDEGTDMPVVPVEDRG